MQAMSNLMMCITFNDIVEHLAMIEKEKALLTKINICKFLEQ